MLVTVKMIKLATTRAAQQTRNGKNPTAVLIAFADMV